MPRPVHSSKHSAAATVASAAWRQAEEAEGEIPIENEHLSVTFTSTNPRGEVSETFSHLNGPISRVATGVEKSDKSP